VMFGGQPYLDQPDLVAEVIAQALTLPTP